MNKLAQIVRTIVKLTTSQKFSNYFPQADDLCVKYRLIQHMYAYDRKIYSNQYPGVRD